MPRRLRNLCLALAVSCGMWVVIIQGTLAIYAALGPSAVDSFHTASVR